MGMILFIKVGGVFGVIYGIVFMSVGIYLKGKIEFNN